MTNEEYTEFLRKWIDSETDVKKRAVLVIAESIETENEKLRELARRFGEYVSQDRCEGCVVKSRCNNGDVEECWQMTEIRALANELGIEGV